MVHHSIFIKGILSKSEWKNDYFQIIIEIVKTFSINYSIKCDSIVEYDVMYFPGSKML